MAPEENDTRRTTRRLSEDEDDKPADEDEGQVQYLYIIRHGDRWDYENKEWSKSSPRPGDPPLSQLGHEQARETGLFLNQLLAQDGITSVDDITWLSSPFLRCLQTSDGALNALTCIKQDKRKIAILPEYSVFEWDAKGGDWHASLPPLEERRHYFPRLAWTYQSLFVPPLPESRDVFLARCQRAMGALQERFPFRPRTALVVVTHAAACIGLVQAAMQGTLADVNPAAPCGVYRLTRHGADPTRWHMDACDKPGPGNLNGHADHLSRLSPNTIAWNHFGDKKSNRGYTGPITSKFAPTEVQNKPHNR